MPLGLHLPELIIILVVALLVFGPKKLPEMGSSIGKSIKEFKKGMNELKEKDKEPEGVEAPVAEYKSPDAMRNELEALEREIASKKAQAAAYEASHAEAPTE